MTQKITPIGHVRPSTMNKKSIPQSAIKGPEMTNANEKTIDLLNPCTKNERKQITKNK